MGELIVVISPLGYYLLLLMQLTLVWTGVKMGPSHVFDLSGRCWFSCLQLQRTQMTTIFTNY